MKRYFYIFISILCSSCQKNEEQKLLYNQVVDYRDDLKMTVKSQEAYIFTVNENSDLKLTKLDSLNKINSELNQSFESLRFGDRKKIVKLRDNFNLKYKLNFNFDSLDQYKNISDTTLNRLIEIDILKLQKQFQILYMFPRRDK